jgi:hypothetical protein
VSWPGKPQWLQTRTTTSNLAPHQQGLTLTCRPDTSGAVPGAFVILLAQDADSAWTFTVRQVPLWLGRLVQVSGTSCKLHYFTQCRSDLTRVCVVVPVKLALSSSVLKVMAQKSVTMCCDSHKLSHAMWCYAVPCYAMLCSVGARVHICMNCLKLQRDSS